MLVTFDNLGRVQQCSPTPALENLAQLEATLKSVGQRYLVTGSDAADIWVEDPLSDKPIPRLRPVLPGKFDKTSETGEILLEPNEISTFPDLPACRITVTGPGISGEAAHPGGPLPVRFLAPGEYLISFEPFPYRRREFKITIRMGAPS